MPRTIQKVLTMLITVLLLASWAGATSYPGEEILGDPDALKDQFEGLVYTVVEAIGRYSMDELGVDSLSKVTAADSPAIAALRRFDRGWFYTHKSAKFTNRRTENWQGDGQTQFSCECYMDCIVHMRGNISATYDMAYKVEFQYDAKARSEQKWRLVRFQNVPQVPDSVDLDQLNAMDDGIRIEAVTGPTFKGFMVIISDPSRVYVGSIPAYRGAGWTLDQFAEKTGAAVVINGGAFSDPNGMGSGSSPVGIVISEGVKLHEHVRGHLSETVVGFNTEDRLVVRQGLAPHKIDAFGFRDAVAFNPALIIHDETIESTENRDLALSARTAIGQREDGTVLMLVVDGRQPDSLGANMSGITQIMRNYGAVNASNLDGGTSTGLVFYGQKINDGSSPDRVSRQMPTAFLVRPPQD